VSVVDGGASVEIESRLMHTSGQWLASTLTMPVSQRTPQGIGSAITYGRRYGLAALLGVAAETDDDGNEGSAREGSGAREAPTRRPPAERKSKADPKSEAKCTGPASPIAQACRDRVRELAALEDAQPGKVWAWWCNKLEIPAAPDGNPPTSDQLTVSEGTRMKDALAEELDAVKRRKGEGQGEEADGLDDDLATLNRATKGLESSFPGTTKVGSGKDSRASDSSLDRWSPEAPA
jgi:hypothetical protein